VPAQPLKARNTTPGWFSAVVPSSVINAVGVVGTFAFLGAGLAISAVCAGGYSLMLFGAAILLLGILFFRWGAWATIIPFALAALVLVAGGWYGASVAGCRF